MNLKNRKFLLTSLVIIISFIFLSLLWNMMSITSVGGNDFIGYWSATYLLQHGQNPYDPKLLNLIQHVQIQSDLDFTIMTWNPPTLFVFLLPLTWLPFPTAKLVWLLTNLVIVQASIFMLVQSYLSETGKGLMFAYLLFTISFPPVITGIYMGQVTFLVPLSLIVSMVLINKKQWFWAGAVLIFTSIKPHIAILATIYLLSIMAKERKHRGWIGLASAGGFCGMVLFTFRPQWVIDFSGLLAIAPVNWATPTLGGFFNSHLLSTYPIIFLLPLPFILAKFHPKIGIEFSVALLTVVTVPFTFFGWSYDQAILLIPIAQIFNWIYRLNSNFFKIGLTLAAMASLVVNYWQRFLFVSDKYYFWFPLFWCLFFGFTLYFVQHTKQTVND